MVSPSLGDFDDAGYVANSWPPWVVFFLIVIVVLKNSADRGPQSTTTA